MVYTQAIINIQKHVCIVLVSILRMDHKLVLEVWVSQERHVVESAHTVSQMVPECSSCRLGTVQKSHNDGHLASILPKLGAKHSADLLYYWCSEIGLLNVSGLDLQIIQRSKSECNVHSFT